MIDPVPTVRWAQAMRLQRLVKTAMVGTKEICRLQTIIVHAACPLPGDTTFRRPQTTLNWTRTTWPSVAIASAFRLPVMTNYSCEKPIWIIFDCRLVCIRVIHWHNQCLMELRPARKYWKNMESSKPITSKGRTDGWRAWYISSEGLCSCIFLICDLCGTLTKESFLFLSLSFFIDCVGATSTWQHFASMDDCDCKRIHHYHDS